MCSWHADPSNMPLPLRVVPRDRALRDSRIRPGSLRSPVSRGGPAGCRARAPPRTCRARPSPRPAPVARRPTRPGTKPLTSSRPARYGQKRNCSTARATAPRTLNWATTGLQNPVGFPRPPTPSRFPPAPRWWTPYRAPAAFLAKHRPGSQGSVCDCAVGAVRDDLAFAR